MEASRKKSENDRDNPEKGAKKVYVQQYQRKRQMDGLERWDKSIGSGARRVGGEEQAGFSQASGQLDG